MNIRAHIFEHYDWRTVMRTPWFVLASLAAAFLAWLIVVAGMRGEAVDDISKILITINSGKTAQVEDWLDRKEREAERLSGHPFLGEIIQQELAAPGSRRAQLNSWLMGHTRQKLYRDMAFLTPAGKAIAATPGYSRDGGAHFDEAFSRAKKGPALITGLYLNSEGLPRITMLSPISSGGRGGRPICVLVIDIDPGKEFYPLLKASPLFFAKAETLVVRREGDIVRILNEPEYRPGSALKLTLPLSDPRLPAAAAFRLTGFFAGVDYRGEKVFSALAPVRGSDMAVVTKIDQGLILAPLRTRQYLALALLVMAALLLDLAAYLVVRYRERSAREIIKEGARRLEALFSNLPGLSYRCANDAVCTMEFLSQGCAGLTGYAPAELMGDKEAGLERLILAEDRQRVKRERQAGLLKDGKYLIGYSIMTRDGTIKKVLDQGLAVIGAGGGLEALEGYMQDITPLKAAEEALHESERIFGEFMEHSPIYIFFKDENLRSVLLSRNFEKMLGRPLDQLLGKNMYELFPSEMAKRMLADDRRIMSSGKEVVLEEELNGRSYRTTKFPILVKGKPPYLAGYTMDITAQKQAEEKVARMNERFLLAARAAHFGVWDWNVAEDKLVWDDNMFELYGVEKHAFSGNREGWFKGLHPEDRAFCEENLQQALRGEKEYDISFRILLSDGGVRHIKANGEVFRDDDGKPRRMVGVNYDVTGIKQAQETLETNAGRVKALLQLNQMTEASTKEITDYALEQSLKITRSEIGYLAFLDEDESVLNMQSWSKSAMAECAIADKRMSYPVSGTGLWGEAVRQRRPVITNDYAAPSPMKKGCPKGHVELKSHLGVPVFSGTRIVLVIGVGNKAGDYDQNDVQQLSVLMEGMWRMLERKRAEEALRASEAEVRAKLHSLLAQDGELENLELGDVLDVAELQKIMDEFYKLTQIAIGILDIKGKVLVVTGWQDICSKFHRVNPVTARNCLESDTQLSEGIKPGECRSYLCKNGLRDMSTPIMVGGKHLGNLFLGQFLYDDEPSDPETFRAQAKRYGFDEKEYLEAYGRLPRFGREQVDTVMRFYTRLAELLSALSYGKIKLARALAQSRQAQLDKDALNQTLAAQNKEMENFLYITTHDLRSPLVNIQGFSQSLEHYMKDLMESLGRAQLPPEAAGKLDKLAGERIPMALTFVRESARKMDALITALLKVSRLGRVQMKPEELDMNALLGKVLDSLRFQLQEAGGEANVGTLPACRADRDAVSQMFSNLLDNAIKYRSGERTLAIKVTGERKGKAVVYALEDNGPGIPARDLPRIWEVFHKLPGSRGKTGEGIGLSMVKKMAEKNDGGIWAESAEGKGTVFYVELPAADMQP